MAIPIIDSIFPNDGSNGVPLGAEIKITFDRGIDLKSGKDNVVIYGVDFDKTSGPDSAMWINGSSNPYFLTSPGFSGTVECDYDLVYVDVAGDPVDPQPDVLSEADEIAAGLRHMLIVRPKALLAPNANFKVYIIGDSEGGTSRGISARTVFDIDDSAIADPAATMVAYGGYEGSADDKIHVKITTPGDIGVAKYKWWYDSAGEPTAITGKVTSRRYRRLDNGLQIRFTGSDYTLNDDFVFKVAARDFLADSFTFSFDTGVGSVQAVPETASTSVIGTIGSLNPDQSFLEIVDMNPDDGSTHMPLNTRTISIKFSENLDPTTITDDSVTIYSYPVSGRYNDKEVEELIERVHNIAKKNKFSSIKISKNEKQRLKFWEGRKAAFPACGDMAPDYYCMDGTIPRGKLAEVLTEIGRLSKKYNLPVANAFHAGDGNLHPLIMYDANEKKSLERTEKFGADILKYCVKVGGVLTGEHGVGVEKRELMCEMFNNNDIQQQIKIKRALDSSSLLNPGKVYPILRKCAEEGRVHVHRGKTKFPGIPRF